MGGAPVVPGYHGGATIIANNVGQVAMGSHHLAQAPVAPQANGQRGAYGSGRQAAANARWDQGMN
ncbi:hypothetical protein EJ04DRAFT_509456 [Polyplosphaeria fusca]|uniref:Uncharacterized protein n=1 Tax=Polyplosphaeria fusca TaxID=682080 RepID=A0A9P4V6Q4_9PLEO|nr:hypothetical protein EJ04DRAFT_509456 [Polyplosphaeria fusca]